MLDWRRYRLERHCQNAFQILYQFIAPAMVFKTACFYTMLRISYLSSLLNFCQYYKINFWFTFPWSSHLIFTIVIWSMYYHFPQLANLETRFKEAFFFFSTVLGLRCLRTSLVATTRGYSPKVVHGLLTAGGLSCCRAGSPGHAGFSSWGTWTQ